MNIGFFADTYTPLVDGIVRSIIQFREGLEARGHTVYLFCPEPTSEGLKRYGQPDPPDDPHVFRFASIDSVFVPGYPLALPISFRASHAIPKLQLDVIHSHSPILVGMFGDLFAFLENIPKIYTSHTYYAEYSRDYLLGGQELTPKMVEKFEKLYMDRSDAVVVPSEKISRVLREQYKYTGELSVIPTGLHLPDFAGLSSDAFLERFPALRRKKILLFAGRLGKEKNIGFLLKAMRALADVPDAVFVIAGEGRFRVALQKEANDLVRAGRVVFAGVLPRPLMLSAFSSASLFLFSSLTDTQGLVLSEAVACGVPIVMVNDPGVSHAVVPEVTARVTPEDPTVFAGVVRALLMDPAAHAAFVEGCRKTTPSLSMDASLDALEALYKHVITVHREESWRTRARAALTRAHALPFPGAAASKPVDFKSLLARARKLFRPE